MKIKLLISSMIYVFLFLSGGAAFASENVDHCDKQDFVNRISAYEHCLVLDTYQSPNFSSEPTLIVFVHGDYLKNRGGRSLKGMRSVLPKVDQANAVLVALTRPGYQNEKEQSSGNHYYYEGDAYRDHTVRAVSHAILKLKDHYQSSKLVVIGHSGGASILGLGMGIVDGFAPDTAILIGGNFYVEDWAKHMNINAWYQGRGLSPHQHIDSVNPNTKIIAVTGANDDVALPVYGEKYVAELQKLGKNASFQSIAGYGHNDILRNRDMWNSFNDDIFAP
ncbi:prolyl oligopeptidase family serine peptidase [Curvivirga sp.]|uniref:prolyl oligopeptidase family serine peptidase n=1 Tax=Curvivirga sp. TaxID=2856848 RepID=UPI003B5B81CD